MTWSNSERAAVPALLGPSLPIPMIFCARPSRRRCARVACDSVREIGWMCARRVKLSVLVAKSTLSFCAFGASCTRAPRTQSAVLRTQSRERSSRHFYCALPLACCCKCRHCALRRAARCCAVSPPSLIRLHAWHHRAGERRRAYRCHAHRTAHAFVALAASQIRCAARRRANSSGRVWPAQAGSV